MYWVSEDGYLKKCFAKVPTIATRMVVDELVLVPILRDEGIIGKSHVLNGVAVHIWELLDGQRRVADIRDMLAEEFDISAEVAEADLGKLIQYLEQIGFVRSV